MNPEEAVEKGILKVCNRHGDPVYYDFNIGCPLCALELSVQQEQPKQSARLKKSIKSVEPMKPVPKKEEELPQGRIDRIKAWSLRKKVVMAIIIVAEMWLFLNYKAIFSYFTG